ncbi:MAG: heavy metal translocating P-type ATPase [Cyanobacteria bacterium P01_G01_bin.38]
MQIASTPEFSIAQSNLSLPPTATAVLNISGMKCAGCVRTVENRLNQCDGVRSATVNLVTEVAAVEYVPAQVTPELLAQTVTAAGFPTQARDTTAFQATTTDWVTRKAAEQRTYVRQFAIATLLLILSTIGHLKHFGWLNIPILSSISFHAGLATLTLALPAREILMDGWQGARRGAPNMNTLVSLGALSAYLTSLVALLLPGLGWECFFDEPVMLLSFILLGRTLEERARFRAANALRSLISLQPTLARLLPTSEPSESAIEIPVEQVQVGEWLQVLPSEKMPVDGVVETGQTTVDESMLTGESMPATKQPGDIVAAGTLNQSGVITLKVTQTGADTVLSRMIALVETAQTRKAPIQGLADVISGYFTYGVLGLAALTFLFWYFIGLPLWPEVMQPALGHLHSHHQMTQLSSTWLVSLKLAISVLVIACPCALGLATPTAILVGSGIGAERGLLIRGGDILEEVHHLDTVVFDKTGTLTAGHPQVSDCISLGPDSLGQDWSETDLIQLAATVESGTHHPLAVAIRQAAETQALPLLNATEFETKAGFGTVAKIDHQWVRLGNQTWLTQAGISLDDTAVQTAQTLAQAGKTVVYVAIDNQLAGLIAVIDPLRENALETVERLQQMGLAVHILSGDRKAAADAIAAQLNLPTERVQAEVTPEGKVSAVAQLQTTGHRVGFVGDGINDAPALAQANVGIALNSGTEAAMETADIVLMRDALTDVAEALHLSRATFYKIRQNLAWAFTYNLVCIPLAAGALLPIAGISLNPGFAGGFMAFSSVSVVVNSLLLRWQLRKGRE